MPKELEAEGYAREVVRKIQALRKEAGLKKENKIELAIQTRENFIPVLRQQEEYIREKTNAKTLVIDDKVTKRYPYSKIEKVKKEEIHIMLIALTE